MTMKTNLFIAALLVIGWSCKGSKDANEANTKTENVTHIAKSIENTQWELIEAMGKPVSEYGKLNSVPGFFFDSKEQRFHGNAGCNGMGGTYKLLEGNRIELSQIMSTQMACPAMELETLVGNMLPTMDNYVINDKGELVITKARMAPVFRFKAVKEKR